MATQNPSFANYFQLCNVNVATAKTEAYGFSDIFVTECAAAACIVSACSITETNFNPTSEQVKLLSIFSKYPGSGEDFIASVVKIISTCDEMVREYDKAKPKYVTVKLAHSYAVLVMFRTEIFQNKKYLNVVEMLCAFAEAESSIGTENLIKRLPEESQQAWNTFLVLSWNLFGALVIEQFKAVEPMLQKTQAPEVHQWTRARARSVAPMLENTHLTDTWSNSWTVSQKILIYLGVKEKIHTDVYSHIKSHLPLSYSQLRLSGPFSPIVDENAFLYLILTGTALLGVLYFIVHVFERLLSVPVIQDNPQDPSQPNPRTGLVKGLQHPNSRDTTFRTNTDLLYYYYESDLSFPLLPQEIPVKANYDKDSAYGVYDLFAKEFVRNSDKTFYCWLEKPGWMFPSFDVQIFSLPPGTFPPYYEDNIKDAYQQNLAQLPISSVSNITSFFLESPRPYEIARTMLEEALDLMVQIFETPDFKPLVGNKKVVTYLEFNMHVFFNIQHWVTARNDETPKIFPTKTPLLKVASLATYWLQKTYLSGWASNTEKAICFKHLENLAELFFGITTFLTEQIPKDQQIRLNYLSDLRHSDEYTVIAFNGRESLTHLNDMGMGYNDPATSWLCLIQHIKLSRDILGYFLDNIYKPAPVPSPSPPLPSLFDKHLWAMDLTVAAAGLLATNFAILPFDVSGSVLQLKEPLQYGCLALLVLAAFKYKFVQTLTNLSLTGTAVAAIQGFALKEFIDNNMEKVLKYVSSSIANTPENIAILVQFAAGFAVCKLVFEGLATSAHVFMDLESKGFQSIIDNNRGTRLLQILTKCWGPFQAYVATLGITHTARLWLYRADLSKETKDIEIVRNLLIKQFVENVHSLFPIIASMGVSAAVYSDAVGGGDFLLSWMDSEWKWPKQDPQIAGNPMVFPKIVVSAAIMYAAAVGLIANQELIPSVAFSMLFLKYFFTFGSNVDKLTHTPSGGLRRTTALGEFITICQGAGITITAAFLLHHARQLYVDEVEVTKFNILTRTVGTSALYFSDFLRRQSRKVSLDNLSKRLSYASSAYEKFRDLYSPKAAKTVSKVLLLWAYSYLWYSITGEEQAIFQSSMPQAHMINSFNQFRSMRGAIKYFNSYRLPEKAVLFNTTFIDKLSPSTSWLLLYSNDAISTVENIYFKILSPFDTSMYVQLFSQTNEALNLIASSSSTVLHFQIPADDSGKRIPVSIINTDRGIQELSTYFQIFPLHYEVANTLSSFSPINFGEIERIFDLQNTNTSNYYNSLTGNTTSTGELQLSGNNNNQNSKFIAEILLRDRIFSSIVGMLTNPWSAEKERLFMVKLSRAVSVHFFDAAIPPGIRTSNPGIILYVVMEPSQVYETTIDIFNELESHDYSKWKKMTAEALNLQEQYTQNLLYPQKNDTKQPPPGEDDNVDAKIPAVDTNTVHPDNEPGSDEPGSNEPGSDEPGSKEPTFKPFDSENIFGSVPKDEYWKLRNSTYESTDENRNVVTILSDFIADLFSIVSFRNGDINSVFEEYAKFEKKAKDAGVSDVIMSYFKAAVFGNLHKQTFKATRWLAAFGIMMSAGGAFSAAAYLLSKLATHLVTIVKSFYSIDNMINNRVIPGNAGIRARSTSPVRVDFDNQVVNRQQSFRGEGVGQIVNGNVINYYGWQPFGFNNNARWQNFFNNNNNNNYDNGRGRGGGDMGGDEKTPPQKQKRGIARITAGGGSRPARAVTTTSSCKIKITTTTTTSRCKIETTTTTTTITSRCKIEITTTTTTTTSRCKIQTTTTTTTSRCKIQITTTTTTSRCKIEITTTTTTSRRKIKTTTTTTTSRRKIKTTTTTTTTSRRKIQTTTTTTPCR
jgi:hypothetical protein